MRFSSPCRRSLALLLALALVGAACGGGDDDDVAGGDGEQTEADGTSADAGGDEADDGSNDGDAEPTEEVAVSTPTPGVETPVPGGTLRYGLDAEVDGLNPTTSALAVAGLVMANAVFDSLAAYDENGTAVPNLAESITPNADATSWTVTLRPDITFHDGTPLNADAILANFEAQRGDALVGLAVKPFFPEDGAVEKLDDLSVQFNLLDTNQYFPATLAGQLGLVSSPTWLAAAAEDPTLNQQPVGTGPFVFDSRSQDSVTRFVRNDDWWGGEVYLEAIEFFPVTDPDTRNSLLLEGELDAIHSTDAPSIEELRGTEGLTNVLDETGEEFFAMMNTESPPFNDIRARQALTYAAPRQNYIDLITAGLSEPADSLFFRSTAFHNPDVIQESDQPDLAGPLVAEYCAEVPDECTDGKINMELQWSGPAVVQTRTAEVLNEGWGEFFNVTFQELPQDQHVQEVALGVYDVVTWRQFGAVDPGVDNVWLLCRTIGGISLNWPRFCDETRDQLLLDAWAETDPTARAALYQELAQMLHDDFTYVFLQHITWDNAFAANVRGVCDRTSPEGVLLRCFDNGRTWHSSVWLAS